VPLLGPALLSLPAGFSLEPNWPALVIPVPATLDVFYTTFPFRLRMKAVDPATMTVISTAQTDFRIT
jgi:hypothetical protein